MDIEVRHDKIDEMEWEELGPKIRRKMVYGEKAMVSFLQLDDGFLVPQHSHENEQITHLISGKMRFWFGAEREKVIDLNPGETLVIPANLLHEALMIGDVVETDVFAPPREDWINKTDDYLRQED